MSFQDIDEDLDQAFVVSQSNVDLLGDTTPQSVPPLDVDVLQPSFNQSVNDILDESNPVPLQISISNQRSALRKSIIPQTNQGVFQYLIESEKRLFEFFQSFLHRL
jgi:adenine C2-methylase RlmN of 23S rRNA A2503 and tRNA A37